MSLSNDVSSTNMDGMPSLQSNSSNNMMCYPFSFLQEDSSVGCPTRKLNERNILKSSSFTTHLSTVSSHLTQKSNTSRKPSPPSRAVWKLANLPAIPLYSHPLEPTHVLVADVPPSIIGERIATTLKTRSIQADYYFSKAVCVTPDNVDFRIFCYRHNHHKNTIVVEVQRRYGNSTNFHHDVRSILDAARGCTCEHDPPSSPRVNEDGCSLPSLEFFSKMLDVPGAEIVALQALVAFTDPAKTGPSTANQVARLLFDQDVGNKVVDLMETHTYMVLVILSNARLWLPRSLFPTIFDKMRTSSPRIAHLAAKCLEPLLDADCDSNIWHYLQEALAIGKCQHQGLAIQARRCLDVLKRS